MTVTCTCARALFNECGLQEMSLCKAGGACSHGDRACSTPGRFIRVGGSVAQCGAGGASLRPHMRRHALLYQLGNNKVQVHHMHVSSTLQHVSVLMQQVARSKSLQRMLLPIVLPRQSLLDHNVLP